MSHHAANVVSQGDLTYKSFERSKSRKYPSHVNDFSIIYGLSGCSNLQSIKIIFMSNVVAKRSYHQQV